MNPRVLRALARDEGSLEFKIDAYRLFDGDENVLMASAGPVGVRVYRVDGGRGIRFDRVESPDGQRSAVADISGLDAYDYFRVFLTWSRDDLAVHIGPHPPVDGELRQSVPLGDD